MDTTSERIIRIEEHVEHIRKILDGNGHSGLIQRIENNEKWRYTTTGGLILLVILVGWLISIVY